MEVPRHPWRRYFARLLDISLYGLPFLAVELLWFHIPIKTFDRWWFQLLNSYLAYGVMLLAEPFLLHFWATTPGKAVFGITVRDAQGEKLSLHWARRRTFEVFAYGMGCGVPWYSLWKEYQALKAAREGDRLEWEFGAEGKPERLEVPSGLGSWLAYGFLQLATLALTVVLVLLSLLPPHRGEGLTMAEFADNYNFYVRRFSRETYLMDSGGGLTDNPEFHARELWNDPDGALRWSPIYEGEELTGYRYVLDTDTAYYRLDPAYQFYGTWAFFGSLPETSCFDLIPWQWEALLEEQALNFDFSYRGLRLTRRAEARGFGESWDNTAGLLVAPQGEKGHIYLEFTVTKE